MIQRVQISEVQLRSWRATGYPYKLIAAEIAEWAAGKERGTALPDDAGFGRGLDRVVGPRPFLRAKHLLERHGVLERHGGRSTTARSTSRKEAGLRARRARRHGRHPGVVVVILRSARP
jgi:hypothetical protein